MGNLHSCQSECSQRDTVSAVALWLTRVIAKLYRVDKIYFESKQLQRKYSAFVSYVAMHDMTLYAQHSRSGRVHRRSYARSPVRSGCGIMSIGSAADETRNALTER